MKLPGWIGVAAVVVLTAAAAACGGGTPPPSSSDPPPSGERISGNERLGWNQRAADENELATFRYVAYVDGTRVELANVSCGNANGATFPCSSRMPAMTPGAHTIELASFTTDNGAIVESSRSTGLRVIVTGASPAGPSSAARDVPAFLTTADGAELRLDVLSEELTFPTALAIAPDGRIFVAEREGRIRILRNGALDPEPAVVIDDVMMTSGADGGLLGLVLDPQFERTRFLYAVYTVADSEDARRFRLVRYREVGDRLGERVVLLDRVPASARPSAALGLGPDGRLYVAFDLPAATGRTAAAASYSGKILRLNTDGTTPEDQPAGVPVFAADFQSPRGLDWHPVTGKLWAADVRSRAAEELRIVGAVGSDSRLRIPLPAGTGAAAVAFYRGTLLPALTGDLLVAADEGRHLLRLRFDKREPARIASSERLLEDAAVPIRTVAVTADGLVYIGTDHAVLRLGPR
jgi:aldose sugar dehydrogenase